MWQANTKSVVSNYFHFENLLIDSMFFYVKISNINWTIFILEKKIQNLSFLRTDFYIEFQPNFSCETKIPPEINVYRTLICTGHVEIPYCKSCTED